MFFSFVFLGFSRSPRTIFVDPRVEGDCFSTPCSMKDAARVIRAADTVNFPDNYVIKPTSYPSEFSDLFVQVSLNNATVYSHNSVVDGSLLSGEYLTELMSHPEYTWTLMVGWTFRNFAKTIFVRTQTWSSSPSYVFRDCTFEDCSKTPFRVSGGTYIFENCVFKNIDEYVLRSQLETYVEFVDCKFENCRSIFLMHSDATFINCIFKNTTGDRGGSIYSHQSTLHVDHCFFINTRAKVNGGAIYIRDSNASYESEVVNSCFYETECGKNGTAIYSYSSALRVSDCSFTSRTPIYSFESAIQSSNNKEGNDCTECLQTNPVDYIPYDFTPVDTFKLTQLDDISGDVVIELSDDEDDDIIL